MENKISSYTSSHTKNKALSDRSEGACSLRRILFSAIERLMLLSLLDEV